MSENFKLLLQNVDLMSQTSGWVEILTNRWLVLSAQWQKQASVCLSFWEKKPDYLESFIHRLGIPGAVSFGVAVAQEVE